jgi:hypothetical protein
MSTEPARSTGAAFALTPDPRPWPLPDDYPRHDPEPADLHAAMDRLSGHRDWPRLSWTDLVEGLLRVGVTDIPLGRLVEGHVDALRILGQAGVAPRPAARYGVWASRSAGTGVAAVVEGESLRLNGTIRFASGAGIIDRALVPVWLDPETHVLVDLAVDGLPVDRSHWHTSAMRISHSHTVTVADLVVGAAQVVGEPGFYLGRPGFLPGGVGVAAVWAGGLTRVLDVSVAMLAGRRVTEAQDCRLGRARLQLIAALTAVRTAGTRLDQLWPDLPDPTTAARVAEIVTTSRALVAHAVTTALAEVRVLAGPAGLAFDPDLGHALDDLGLYAAQLPLDAEATRMGTALRSDRR